MNETRCRKPPCRRPIARAERARDNGADRDRKAYADRNRKKQNLRRESDGGGELRVAEPRYPQKRQQIDGEDRHEPNRARRRHNDDVAHGRAFGEDRARDGSGSQCAASL
jgi:hypothetical protein